MQPGPLRTVLRAHFLHGVRLGKLEHHIAVCHCGREMGWEPSRAKAVDAWIDHVLREVRVVQQ